jgi:hypothetical protein
LAPPALAAVKPFSSFGYTVKLICFSVSTFFALGWSSQEENMDQEQAIESTLKEILSKIDEIHELLAKPQKRESTHREKIFEPLLKAPNVSRITEDAHDGGN